MFDLQKGQEPHVVEEEDVWEDLDEDIQDEDIKVLNENRIEVFNPTHTHINISLFRF